MGLQPAKPKSSKSAARQNGLLASTRQLTAWHTHSGAESRARTAPLAIATLPSASLPVFSAHLSAVACFARKLYYHTNPMRPTPSAAAASLRRLSAAYPFNRCTALVHSRSHPACVRHVNHTSSGATHRCLRHFSSTSAVTAPRHPSASSPDRSTLSPAASSSAVRPSSHRLSASEQLAALASIPTSRIRNFSIIAHIDHGKSTLADRLLELAGNIGAVSASQSQVLDQLQVERERGITVKAQTASLFYTHTDGLVYLLNLIDTPGHVDFSYEVSRSLAACDGVLLLVDVSQGIQAQTLANYHLAHSAGLAVVPVMSKVDLQASEIDRVADEMCALLAVGRDSLIGVSSKTGHNIDRILPAVIERIPPPSSDKFDKPSLPSVSTAAASSESSSASSLLSSSPAAVTVTADEQPLSALVFDSWFSPHHGAVLLLRIVSGSVHTHDKVALYHSNTQYEVQELGLLLPHQLPTPTLQAGQVGYMVAGIRTMSEVRLGETIFRLGGRRHKGAVSAALWQAIRSNTKPLTGFKPAKSQFIIIQPTPARRRLHRCRLLIAHCQLTMAMRAQPARYSHCMLLLLV